MLLASDLAKAILRPRVPVPDPNDVEANLTRLFGGPPAPLCDALRKAFPGESQFEIQATARVVNAQAWHFANAATAAEATAQIARLNAALAETAAALDAMNPEVMIAIDGETEANLKSVGDVLQTSHLRSTDVAETLALLDPDWSRSAPDDVRFAFLRQRKRSAKAVTLVLAKTWRKVKGVPPTVITPPSGGKAYGPFLDLLGEVFAFLGINASPESQTRVVLKRMEFR